MLVEGVWQGAFSFPSEVKQTVSAVVKEASWGGGTARN